MKRILATTAVVAAAVLATAGVANASPVKSASQMDCNNAAGLTATAQTNATNTLNVLVARAKELGFTAQQISDAQKVIADSKTVADAQSGLMMVYSEHPVTGFDPTADLKLVGNAVTARLNLAAAQAAQNIACAGGLTPGAPATAANGTTTTTTTTTTNGGVASPGAVVQTPTGTGIPTGDGTVLGR